VALFHFDGIATPTVLTDSSGTGKVATITGNPVISTGQSKFGGASLYINGNSTPRTNYVAIDGSGSTDFALDGDFTIDWWQYLLSITNTYGASIVVSPTAVPQCTNVRECLVWGWGSWNTTCCDLGQFSCPGHKLNAWQHIALVRQGSILRYFMDGAKVGEASRPGTLGAATVWLSGTSAGNGDNGDLNGYIDELRIVKGTAVWTSDFTPPTAPYAAPGGPFPGGGTPDGPPPTPDAQSAAPDATSAGSIGGLVGYWKFDDGNGIVAVDSSGMGNTGTLTKGLIRNNLITHCACDWV
jgi:hypothetical protein